MPRREGAAAIANATPPSSPRGSHENPDPERPPLSGPETGSTPPELPRAAMVLQVGDSFADALSKPLKARLLAEGLRTAVEVKTASYIGTWAYGADLPRFVARYKPDLILVTLGANELSIPEPEARQSAIRRLVGSISSHPCVWITPPRWKKDTGVLEVIRRNAAPCRFLDSDQLVGELPRGPDKIHPTKQGSERWAELVLGWLRHERDPSGATPFALKPEPLQPGAPRVETSQSATHDPSRQ
ncbi:MAG TPA: SGNH/GDSL hydrolase family protein [Polyangiaceae bacterium]|nr:SGNH/GDSL hydrolase family protein [Polyangiaceae bacterium]